VESAEHIPAAVCRHRLAPQNLVADRIHGFLQQHPLAIDGDVAQAFVFGCPGAIGGVGGRGKPPLIDTPAMGPQRVEIARIEFQSAAGHQK